MGMETRVVMGKGGINNCNFYVQKSSSDYKLEGLFRYFHISLHVRSEFLGYNLWFLCLKKLLNTKGKDRWANHTVSRLLIRKFMNKHCFDSILQDEPQGDFRRGARRCCDWNQSQSVCLCVHLPPSSCRRFVSLQPRL